MVNEGVPGGESALQDLRRPRAVVSAARPRGASMRRDPYALLVHRLAAADHYREFLRRYDLPMAALRSASALTRRSDSYRISRMPGEKTDQ